MRTGTINCGKCPVAVCVYRVKFRGPTSDARATLLFSTDWGVFGPLSRIIYARACALAPPTTRENSAERRGNGGGGGKQARTSKRLNGEHMTPPSPVWGGPTGKRRHEIIIDEASVLTKLTCAGS